MPTFAYQGRNQAGERVAGTRDAPNQRAALEALRELGLFITQLTPTSRSGRKAPESFSSARMAQNASGFNQRTSC
jgi:type II secretory pathway component PulF